MRWCLKNTLFPVVNLMIAPITINTGDRIIKPKITQIKSKARLIHALTLRAKLLFKRNTN